MSDAAPHRLPTTQWTLIARLRSEDEAEAVRALNDLCRAYHYPLYCYIRRKGLPHHDAQDALHDFFAKLLRNDTFGIADPEKGRLRSFLLTALQRFLLTRQASQLRHQVHEVSLDAEAVFASAEHRYAKEEPRDNESPDQLFDRQWARELMGLVLQRLRDSYEARGKAVLFEVLRPVLLSGGSLLHHDSQALADQLGMRPGALRTALMRLLREYQEALRNEVLQTVADPEQARMEYQTLQRVFNRR